MKIAFFAYMDPEEGPPGRYAGTSRWRADGVYVGHPGCVVIDVADFRRVVDVKRHANYLADFGPDDGIMEGDELLVYDEETGDAYPCHNHWHCDPELAAHKCELDRSKPCPNCGATS